MIGQPFISIIMPAYNCESYIEDAVRSVERQSYQNWELIIIEDVSTDHTWSIIETFNSEKIRIYRNHTNCGVAKTRNRGVELAHGSWIAFLDSDDMWTEDKLERQVSLLQHKEEAYLLFTGSAFITSAGKPIKYILHVPQMITWRNLTKQNLISCSSVLVKRELLQKYKMPTAPLMMHEDFAVWLQILKEIPYAYGIDEPLLIYRVSSNSKSGNKLNAARMNWNTYRYVGMTVASSFLAMISYTFRNLRKYTKIRCGTR